MNNKTKQSNKLNYKHTAQTRWKLSIAIAIQCTKTLIIYKFVIVFRKFINQLLYTKQTVADSRGLHAL